jgi:hypothetical protein
MQYKRIVAASIIAVSLAMVATTSLLTIPFQQQVYAVTVAEVGVRGMATITCPDGSERQGEFVLQAAQDEDGTITSGHFEFRDLAGSVHKHGTITSGTITASDFSLQGTEEFDVWCHASVPTSVSVEGNCGPPPSVPTTTQFTADNGETATIQGDAACTLTPVTPPPLTEQFNNQGQCIREANRNPDAGFTREDCQNAFRAANNGNNGGGN